MHRGIFYVSIMLRKLMIRALGKCVGLGFRLGLEKEKYLRSNIFQCLYLFPHCSLLWVSDV